jgi:hypothetical protein
MANDVTRQAFAREIKEKADAAEQAFEAAAIDTGERIAARINELTQAITQEVDRVVRDTEDTAAEIDELNAHLRSLRDARADLAGLYRQSTGQLERTKYLSDTVINVIESYGEATVDPALHTARGIRKRIYTQISSEIDNLRHTRDELRRKLSKL